MRIFKIKLYFKIVIDLALIQEMDNQAAEMEVIRNNQ